MRIFSCITFLLIMLSMVSCSKDKCANDTTSEECAISEVERIGFFDITYETILSRPVGDSAWQDVAGCREMKFATTLNVDDSEALPAALTGGFTIAMQSFRRTSSAGFCSGGNTGSFSLTFQDSESTDSIAAEDKPPYSMFEPYNDVSRIDYTEAEAIDEDPENEVRTYIFGMVPSRESMQPASQCLGQIYCPSENGGVNDPGGIDQENNPCSYSFKVVRFPSGHLLLDDTSKGVQYYLIPRLSSDSASKCLQSNIPQ